MHPASTSAQEHNVTITDIATGLNNIAAFVAALNEKFNSTTPYTFSVERPGLKFTRIVISSHGSRSVFCFVDAEGNIYKAAGWKAPAKHVRATLATVDMSKVDPYGSWLYIR